MGNKLWRMLLPVGLLVFFLLVMSSDWLFKRPFGVEDDVQLYIETVRNDVLSEDWAAAATNWTRLRAAWRTIAIRVQFSAERSEIEGLTLSLARLQGAILAEDRAGALIELGAAEEHWNDLGR